MESAAAFSDIPTPPVTRDPEVTRSSTMARRVAFEAVALGLLGDQLLRVGPTGIGPAIWFLTATLALASLTRHHARTSFTQRRILLGVLSAMATVLAVREAEAITVCLLLGILSLGALSVSSFRGDLIEDLLDLPVIHAVVGVARAWIAGLVGAIPLMLNDLRAEDSSGRHLSQRSAILRGTVITVPIVAVFVALFAAADPTFEVLTNSLQLDFGELLSHLMLAGILTWIAAGVLRHATLGLGAPYERPRDIETLGRVEIGMVLGAMTFVFTIFVALQLPRMFAGEEFILRQTGLTYAGYARRGFFELIAASSLTLAVIAALRTVAVRDARALRLLRLLGGVLIALVFVILQSALHRLALYIDAYGWSVDRVYATAVIVWLGICFAWSFPTLLGARPQRFIAGALTAAGVVLFTLVAINPAARVVHLNAERARAGRPFDFSYPLSRDAAPALAAELPHFPANMELTVTDCSGLTIFVNQIDRRSDWRAWTWSAWHADRAVASIDTWRAQRCSSARGNHGQSLLP